MLVHVLLEAGIGQVQKWHPAGNGSGSKIHVYIHSKVMQSLRRNSTWAKRPRTKCTWYNMGSIPLYDFVLVLHTLYKRLVENKKDLHVKFKCLQDNKGNAVIRAPLIYQIVRYFGGAKYSRNSQNQGFGEKMFTKEM